MQLVLTEIMFQNENDLTDKYDIYFVFHNL